METKLERIAEISANSPRPEFTSLYHLINKEMLLQCHKELDGNKAVGVDEITKKEYGRNLEQNIDDLVERLKRKSYKPQPSIRVYIPKSNGKLGMSVIAILLLIMGVFENILPAFFVYIALGIILADVVIIIVLGNTICRR